jgi:hypothetical protein
MTPCPVSHGLFLQLHRLFLALRDVYHRDIDPFVDNLLTVRLHLHQGCTQR